jgi:hypothetical protein
LTTPHPVFWIMSTSLPKLMWVFSSRWSHKNMEKNCLCYWMTLEHAEYAVTLSVVHLDHCFSAMGICTFRGVWEKSGGMWTQLKCLNFCFCNFLHNDKCNAGL